jgi:L-iditol 2-dehydrogenase
MVLSLLELKNCSTVLAGISRDRKRLETGKKIGADLAVDTEKEDIKKKLDQELGIGEVDICFECAGAAGSFISCMEHVKKMGSLIQMGIFRRDILLDFNKIVFKQLSIYGSLGFTWEAWDKSLELLKSGRLKLDLFVTHRYRLAEWEEAFKKAGEPGSLKVMINPGID